MKKILLLLGMVSLCVACSAPTSAPGAQNIQVVNAATSSPSAAPTSRPTVRATTQPTMQTPPAEPTLQPTVKPTPEPPTYHSCMASSCPNLWGFVLDCSCGVLWQSVPIAPSGFCSWFHCVPNFNSQVGNIGECGNQEMAHNCAGYGGIIGWLYKYVPVISTPPA